MRGKRRCLEQVIRKWRQEADRLLPEGKSIAWIAGSEDLVPSWRINCRRCRVLTRCDSMQQR